MLPDSRPLWLLFAPSMLPRGLAVDDHGGEFAERITQMYGSQEWLDAYEARRRGLLSPGELRDELLNLMRWRLENVLGYKVTHHFEMKNTHGSPLYNMIFATDNDAGEKIMKHIYGKAASQRPIMQREAAARREAEREAESNAPGLFDPIPKAVIARCSTATGRRTRPIGYPTSGSLTGRGISSHVRPSRVRPPSLGVLPPHCLKK
jgi:hypothetical protein